MSIKNTKTQKPFWMRQINIGTYLQSNLAFTAKLLMVNFSCSKLLLVPEAPSARCYSSYWYPYSGYLLISSKLERVLILADIDTNFPIRKKLDSVSTGIHQFFCLRSLFQRRWRREHRVLVTHFNPWVQLQGPRNSWFNGFIWTTGFPVDF